VGEPIPSGLSRSPTIGQTCSIGWAAYPWHSHRPEELGFEAVLGLADQALYQAKSSGKNQGVGIILLPAPDVQAVEIKPKACPGLSRGPCCDSAHCAYGRHARALHLDLGFLARNDAVTQHHRVACAGDPADMDMQLRRRIEAACVSAASREGGCHKKNDDTETLGPYPLFPCWQEAFRPKVSLSAKPWLPSWVRQSSDHTERGVDKIR